MNKEIKKLWVEALRSDEYKQGTRALSRLEEGNYIYCCLGVLCEIAYKHGIISKDFNEDEMVSIYDKEDIEVLPKKVVTWAGLYNYNPNCKYDDQTTNLATLNDIGLGFAEMANIIEEQL